MDSNLAESFKIAGGPWHTLPGMDANLSAASSFMASHARTLDRRRFELLVEGGAPAPVLAAVDAYRNSDGGYGWGLEPDLRAPESQPGCALHAFEAFADVAPSPDRPVRALFSQETIDAELRRLVEEQHDDGGWAVDFKSYSPAAELEWRGYTTVRAAAILRDN